jgi:hypothetical protein
LVCVTSTETAQATAELDARRSLLGTEALWVRPPDRDRPALMRALNMALGLDLSGLRPRTLFDAENLIIKALQRQPRPIVVLHAHRLHTATLAVLYGIWDEVNVPLVLAGDERLYTRLWHRDLASLRSQVLYCHRLPNAAAAPMAARPGTTEE